jgi:four helix bundle protein
MNNPEVTMHEQQQPPKFDALEKATTAAGIAISLVMRVPAPLKTIADQVIRSASSVPVNARSAGVRVRSRSQGEVGSDRRQARVGRGARSALANLAEGAGRSGRDRIHHWRIAYGSAKEVDIHLRLLIGTGSIECSRAESALQLFDDVRAIT